MMVFQGIVTDFSAYRDQLDRFENELYPTRVDTGRTNKLIQDAVAIPDHTHYILCPPDLSLASDEVY
jgi:hypothetical protein